jgi:hypothetical protein
MGIQQSRLKSLIQSCDLRQAISAGNESDALSLVTRNPKLINMRRPSCGRSALHFAAFRGRTSIAKMLLEHGAKVDIRDVVGRTPLHDAARGGRLECAKLLLLHGANIEAREVTMHSTPLHEAARSLQNNGVVLFLLHQKANPLAVDLHGHNALNYSESSSAAKTLLEFDYTKATRSESPSPSVAFQLLSSRDYCGRGVIELAKEHADRAYYVFVHRPRMEKLEYVESFTQARLAAPGDGIDCDRVHLDTAITLNQELSEFQSVLAHKTYDVLYALEVHQVALPILGYLSPMDVMSQ